VAGGAGQRNKANVDDMKSQHLLEKYEDLGKAFIKTDAWIDLLTPKSRIRRQRPSLTRIMAICGRGAQVSIERFVTHFL